MESSKSVKPWSQMTKEEKQNSMKDIAKLRGFAKSWEEIGEYYSAKSSTVRTAFSDFSKSEKNEEKSCSQILRESTTQIDESLLLQLLDRVEFLELELATVKKLQVETASIERLDETEYNYFLYNGDTLVSKFKTVEDCSNYCSSALGFTSNSGYIERQLEANNGNFKLRGYKIVQSFKKDNDRLERDNAFIKLETAELTRKFQLLEEI